MIRVGNIQMGSISLGRIGTNISCGGASSTLYKQVLAKMPKTLRQSLVCWYSPNLQGLTNKELFDSDNLYEGGLKDLSGNGYDMDLHGFGGIEGSGHVDGDGNLCFDGVDDYAKAIESATFLKESTIFTSRTSLEFKHNAWVFFTEIANGGQRVLHVNSHLNMTTALFAKIGISNSSLVSIGGYKNVETGVTYPIESKSLLRYAIKKDDIVETQYESSVFGSSSISQSTLEGISDYESNVYYQFNHVLTYENCIFPYFVRFNRWLTDEEITWVKDNMLVSQEVKKHKVTLWSGNDENARVLATLNVHSGNSLGSYNDDGDWIAPEYDIDSTHCSDSWYYYGTDELYYADAIEADVNLYCDTQLISESMLSKLENVTLEDGTTAKDHLVCWYSPKLQGLTKKSVLEDGMLEDLSENGMDITLSDFTSSEDVIDGNNALIFNNGKASNLSISPLTDYTIFDGYKYISGTSIVTALASSNNADSKGYILRPTNDSTLMLSIGDSTRKSITVDNTTYINVVAVISSVNNSYVLIDNTQIYGTPLTNGVNKFYYHVGIATAKKGDLSVFDIELDTETIDKVKSIMLRNTPSPTTHKVTFMYGDTEVTSMNVLHESNIYNLPKTELTKALRADKWYKDAELTEEFSNTEYVTEDMTLYCDTEYIYKDSLVAWYSPSLQGLTKESVLADTTLADLSGNQYEITKVKTILKLN